MASARLSRAEYAKNLKFMFIRSVSKMKADNLYLKYSLRVRSFHKGGN